MSKSFGMVSVIVECLSVPGGVAAGSHLLKV